MPTGTGLHSIEECELLSAPHAGMRSSLDSEWTLRRVAWTSVRVGNGAWVDDD